jgi:FkbM family methyltransferase
VRVLPSQGGLDYAPNEPDPGRENKLCRCGIRIGARLNGSILEVLMAANCVRDLIYDVGMHSGEDTEFYLKKGFRVIAFEANSDLAASARNKFHDYIANDKLVIVHGAIVDSSYPGGTVEFYKNNKNSLWGTVSPYFAERNSKLGADSTLIRVPRINFSDCLAKLGVPYYLEIDIEGMDIICLRALFQVEGRPAYVSIESDRTDFRKVSDELKILTQLGYTSFQAVQQTTVHRQMVPRPSREGAAMEHVFPRGSSGLFGKDLPQRWQTLDQISEQYKKIFIGYRVWGEDFGLAQKFFPLKVVRKGLSIALDRRIPGWYDTHAKHSSE